MTFQAVIPMSGIGGWNFLRRTYEAQLETFSASAQRKRDATYFRENIANIKSAEELVSDRRLLSVALGAFGLEADLNNKFFVNKVLTDGTTANDALSNRLADKRYKKFSEAFGFGASEAKKTTDKVAMDGIVESYFKQSFEVSVGQQNDTMRIALYAQRELTELAESNSSETTKWFSVMGLPALRNMFETALGLPSSFSQLDIDKQLEVFQDKTSALFGNDSISQFADPNNLERLTEVFLARAQISEIASTYSPAATALTLLSSL